MVEPNSFKSRNSTDPNCSFPLLPNPNHKPIVDFRRLQWAEISENFLNSTCLVQGWFEQLPIMGPPYGKLPIQFPYHSHIFRDSYGNSTAQYHLWKGTPNYDDNLCVCSKFILQVLHDDFRSQQPHSLYEMAKKTSPGWIMTYIWHQGLNKRPIQAIQGCLLPRGSSPWMEVVNNHGHRFCPLWIVFFWPLPWIFRKIMAKTNMGMMEDHYFPIHWDDSPGLSCWVPAPLDTGPTEGSTSVFLWEWPCNRNVL